MQMIQRYFNLQIAVIAISDFAQVTHTDYVEAMKYAKENDAFLLEVICTYIDRQHLSPNAAYPMMN